MSKEYIVLENALNAIKARIPYTPDVALVLGSGFGDYVESYTKDSTIPFFDVPELPISTVSDHRGQYVFFKIGDKKVVCMQGRVHMYEGYSALEAVRPERLMGMMGAKSIILTNAAGGIDSNLVPGDIMLMTDIISLFVPSPLIGENTNEFGTRFPDMTNILNKDLQEKIRKVAKEKNVNIKEGVFCQVRGPHFETKADIKVLKALGSSAVAMSLGIEAIAMHHMGVKVAGLSMITNYAVGIKEDEINHEELMSVAKSTSKNVAAILENLIKEI